MQEGKKHGGLRIKIPNDIQDQMRARYLAGERPVDIAKEFGVSRSKVENLTRDIRENRYKQSQQPEGTVYCNTSISSKCRYGATVNTQAAGLCNYILITGCKRGCPWQECTKFEKVDKHHMRYEFGLSNLFERKVAMSEIEKVLEEMCDHYCKYPYEIYDDNQLAKICENCPLNKLEAESEET